MTGFINTSKFAPKSPEDEKKQNWHRLDCLTKHKLATEQDSKKLKEWFEQQDSEWRELRQKLFNKRLVNISNRGKYDYLRY